MCLRLLYQQSKVLRCWIHEINNNMKKLITIILLAFTFTVNSQFQLSEDYSFKRDKQWHAIGGTVITTTTFTLVYKKTGDEAFAKRAGIFAGVGAGFFKEMFDGMSGGEIMLSDLFYTSIFSIGTGLTLQGIVKRKKKRVKKRNKKLLETDEDISWDLDNKFLKKVN